MTSKNLSIKESTMKHTLQASIETFGYEEAGIYL